MLGRAKYAVRAANALVSAFLRGFHCMCTQVHVQYLLSEKYVTDDAHVLFELDLKCVPMWHMGRGYDVTLS